ncbi:predicted protein [Nematostella vectensis]|uniref:Uncharacterized protein n=1 Tax=Nematostella vectensis TaxID=45351 RepID=A7SJR2_NEMVE|nr:protein pitchfork [Nematostella vectensis]EDO36035.1 predicted protein [Nematostella vectensis]|eukprot:XP_001628098.1 predicted protein [Nematostella vectensis]
MLSLYPDETSKANVSFGTTLDRELMPIKAPNNRFGNELLAIRGAPNRGPGCYDNAEVSTFVYEQEQRPVCRRGYSLGARTAPRFPKPMHMDVPGAPTYQAVISKPQEFDPAFKPFSVGANRFRETAQAKEALPGAGSYEHDVESNRKIKYHGSFGGPQTLINSVQIKCNNFGERDTCKNCKNHPIGDYYEYKKKHFCRKCYNQLLESGTKYPRSYLQKFYKVRDCSLIHDHEGTNAKLQLKTEKDLRKQRFREAYMSLYFK